MGIKSRYEYLKDILLRYKYATRAQKKISSMNFVILAATTESTPFGYSIQRTNQDLKKPQKEVEKHFTMTHLSRRC